MDFFASVISNNLNIVMKVLASVTILMAIPTIIGGIFGMNIVLPFSNDILMHLIYYDSYNSFNWILLLFYIKKICLVNINSYPLI